MLSGWLSPLVLNFAWFANVFFLAGITSLMKGGIPTWAAIWAGLLSLDTLRLSQFDEGGSVTTVYGYGWGCVLWFLSIFVMMIAVGQRHKEARANGEVLAFGELLLPLGIGFVFVTLGASFYFAIHDRTQANPSEAKRLEFIAFKRGKVCSLPDPVVANPIRNFSGPLEVVIDNNALFAKYPFGQIKELLAWGIPVVRMAGTDYTMVNGALSSVTATGRPTAFLAVTESHSHSIHARLLETATDRVVFDQTWTREIPPLNEQHYCPDYDNAPSQPKHLLMQALGIQVAESPSKVEERQPPATQQLKGTIIDQREGGMTRAKRYALWKEAHPGQNFGLPSHELFNANCPADIGWDGKNYESSSNTGWPFRVKEKAYYLGSREHYNATCDGEFVYLYSSQSLRGQLSMFIEKRDLRDFQQLWVAIINISDNDDGGLDNTLKVSAVSNVSHGMTIEMVNEDSGKILVVEVPLESGVTISRAH